MQAVIKQVKSHVKIPRFVCRQVELSRKVGKYVVTPTDR